MNKNPKRYLEVNPYSIIEEGYHKDRSQVSESLFSLSNEYMGIRAMADEGGDYPKTLRGVYFNGIYDYAKEDTPSAYKGIVKRTHFMINSVDWVNTTLVIDGEKLDLNHIKFSSFKRSLSFLSGEYIRSFTWSVNGNKDVEVSFSRFLSMSDPHKSYQRITLRNISKDKIDVSITLALEGNVIHWGHDCFWNRGFERIVDSNTLIFKADTLTSHQQLLAECHVKDTNGHIKYQASTSPMRCETKASFALEPNESITFDKACVFIADRTDKYSDEELLNKADEELKESLAKGYEGYLAGNKEFWEDFFKRNDIVIEGDDLDQQGVRFALFQLTSAYHGVSPEDNIGAKGLTGEAYSGHAFWDSETYCLPFYLLTNMKAAKDLLMFRYNTLGNAKKRATMLDCKGACYPIATLNGEEGCNLWQHASLQFQPSTGVAYAIYHYYTLTRDETFIKKYGLEMLLEISHFLFDRGQYDQSGTKFGFYGVMGPDEFKMMVNNNAYTNYMAKKTFEFTIEMMDKYGNEDILEKCHVDSEFLNKIEKASKDMNIPYDEKTKVFEQNDGFFSLPHIDINSIPNEDFPLYSHWTYDRIYRYDMIKQPDVLMFLFLYSHCFTKEQKEANYNYYEPRCIHESSLSPSIHSIFASELGKKEEASRFFSYATRLDLDDYNNNTCEGIHMTSLAASYMNIVYGFGGLRSDDEMLSLSPSIPDKWKSYSFSFIYHQANIKVTVEKENFTVEADEDVTLEINGEKVQLKGKKTFLMK